MVTRGMILTLAFVVASTLTLGGVAPQPAEADDTGRILAGLAAGALVYGLLGDHDNDHYRSRGYYDGNRQSWTQHHENIRRYGHSGSQRSYHRQGSSQRRAYEHGWHNGYDRGFDHGHDVGYHRGWNNGFDYGYDRGYDHGFDDGYDRGRRSSWGCWGY